MPCCEGALESWFRRARAFPGQSPCVGLVWQGSMLAAACFFSSFWCGCVLLWEAEQEAEALKPEENGGDDKARSLVPSQAFGGRSGSLSLSSLFPNLAGAAR